ncbi:MAG: efflux RND transporter periplasmic adaptor subunit [Sulfurimonas sp.]
MQKYYKFIAGFAVALVLAFVVYNKVYIPKTSYEITHGMIGDLNKTVFGIGVVDSERIYLISSGVNAKIETIYVDEGAFVKKGELLIKLDSVDLPEVLQESKMGVKKAFLEQQALEQELENIRVQKKLSLQTFKRYENLKSQAYISTAEYDAAKAQLDGLKAQEASLLAHIATAKTSIKSAQKKVQGVEKKLALYKVYAPASGYLVESDVQVGQNVLPAQTMMKIVDPKDVWVKAFIDEKLSGDIKVGAKTTIRIRSDYEKSYTGFVKRIDLQSDSVTQEREVYVRFEEVPIPFYINEQAEVSITAQKFHDTVIIPAKALVYKDQDVGVWIQKDQKAHFQTLKLHFIEDTKAAVSGIDTQAKILLASPKNKTLSEGLRVHE